MSTDQQIVPTELQKSFPTSGEIRQQFLDFFKSKGHQIVPSAPIVIKNDPTLLFTNAGMNQFKDYFLGNRVPEFPRVADTQKCLRVSGKHNDLEEVGVDTYHHTMFEMLGNWSFGDYFKAEAIAWSWELLTEVYKLDKSRLYVTVFEGDEKEGLPPSDIALREWTKLIAEDHIVYGNKKDNFWEMGDTGPCGPCSEIHVDMRSDAERALVKGRDLVNKDHPQVIEIWNNVFMQYNRLKDGTLQPLPSKHVDTGMGFERLVRVIQGKQSNYDTDVFTGTIAAVETITGKKYDYSDTKEAVAFRVLADHIRTIAFTIADGQLPSNNGAGYVIRRILRRAVRYYYSYLDYKQPLLFQLMPLLAKQFEHVFPELHAQVDFVSRVTKEEEDGFLKTLDKGIERFERNIWSELETSYRLNSFLGNNGINAIVGFDDFNTKAKSRVDIYIPEQNIAIEFFRKEKNLDDILRNKVDLLKKETGINIITISTNDIISGIVGVPFFEKLLNRKLNNSKNILQDIAGSIAFELYDTYGFPIDLTQLMASEIGWSVDMKGFEQALQQQKNRSRAASVVDTEDWVVLEPSGDQQFAGYAFLIIPSFVTKFRKVKNNKESYYQIALKATPFYAESGGQVGDKGFLDFDGEEIQVFDTKKENGVILHFVRKLPEDISYPRVIAKVDEPKRTATSSNHSATHLLHAALRQVLGTHVAQKGSLVNDEQLRFDFSHFSKVTNEEIAKVEAIVNQKIRENVPVVIKEMSKDEAVALGAMALFGEKYGDVVRVVMMDPNYSIELCGGTHVGYTGELGYFKIKSESAVAAGVRRIEAVSGKAAAAHIEEAFSTIEAIKGLFNNPKELLRVIENSVADNKELKKKIESLEAKQLVAIKAELLTQVENIGDNVFVGQIIDISNADNLKKLASDVLASLNLPLGGGRAVVLAANIGGKASVAIAISEALVAKGIEAPKVIKEHITPIIKGGGGGQKTLATAGGQDASNLDKVIDVVKGLL